MNVFSVFTAHVQAAVKALAAAGVFAVPPDLSRIVVEPPREASHGDLATNAAMVLAKEAGLKPRELAERLAAELGKRTEITAVEVAGPGFINLTLDPGVWRDALRAAILAGPDFGRSDLGKGEPVNVEYVSANPTGPLHVGHGRGAVFGDALANLLAFGGFAVTREYYINDAGAQVDTLARSAFCATARRSAKISVRSRKDFIRATTSSRSAPLWPRSTAVPSVEKAMQQIKVPWEVFVTRFEEAFEQAQQSPAQARKPGSVWACYAGISSICPSSIRRTGLRVCVTGGSRRCRRSFCRNRLRDKAIEMMMAGIKQDLAALNVRHDVFFSERSLIEARGSVSRRRLLRCGPKERSMRARLPPPKGAPVEDWEDREQTLFRATDFGDDVDRPLKKSDGSYTYFASDIAYHKSKVDRGFRNSSTSGAPITAATSSG